MSNSNILSMLRSSLSEANCETSDSSCRIEYIHNVKRRIDCVVLLFGFLPRDAMLARYMCRCVCLSVRPPKAGLYRHDWTNRAGSWHESFLQPTLECVISQFGYLQKLRYFFLELYPKLWTWKISPRQVDRVVNNTRRRRRRRRSSLLTTPIRQSTSRGCLLQL